MPTALADFLLLQRDAIMEAWEAEVRAMPGARALSRPALRDGLPRLLEVVATLMRERPQGGEASGLDSIPDLHALERLGEGFDLRQVVTEYRLLRGCVLRMWMRRAEVAPTSEAERVFHEAMDEAVAASISRSSQAQAQARERQARAEAEASLARLRESEAGLRRWEEVFTRLGVGVVVVSAEDNILRDVNPAFARMHGYSPEELKGRPLEDTLAPEARGALPRHVAAAHSKLSHEYESLHVRKDGSRFPAYSHVTAFRDGTGRVVQRVATVLDITQRRAVEVDRQRLLAAIEAERARLASVLEQMPAGVFIAEAPGGRLVMTNRQVEALTGQPFHPPSPAEDITRGYPEVLHPDGRPYAPEERPLMRSVLQGEVVRGEELLLPREDGQRLTVLVSSAPIRDRDGAIVAAVATMVDVTERRRAQEAALQAALFGERLIAIVSHDLRNPLNAIQLSATQLLHSEALAERERRLVTRLARSADRMRRMISELLDFTRGRLGGGIPIQRAVGDVRAVVRQGVEELEAAFPERSLRIQVGPGRYEGQWDADRLLQVVSNLGGNALQYGPPELPVTFLLADAGDAVVLEVHNGGEPIAPEMLPRLFDPFRRGTSAGHAGGTGAGLGLGLYIVEQVVKGHGGRIEVQSEAEAGTTFRVTLPRAQPG
ncbi:PAS domain S-box protein [Pyxidicoccus sp. MSG2]|uniref:PAS domain S-box protein n=1 Tax=Pyxidicoccus sp. MSG2 TaxID=2996790 RepID=UPI0022715E43|nr:PAS domain S-box protein [Pyxidicoccus sp. MSG2]MCY1018917.1 PAS domain S-box protein [Pyxidicoccus sp. MSG2]